MKTETKSREFTDVDWFGFAGAQRWDDGSAPVIREFSDDEDGAMVVADPTGVCGYAAGEVDCDCYYLVCEFETQSEAIEFLDSLPADFDPRTHDGFEEC